MPTLPFSTIQKQLEKIDRLESQVSPENFWCDGEKPNTPANRRQWQRLQMRLEKAQVKGEGLLAKLTPEQRKTILEKLPERLRFTLSSLLPPAPAPRRPRRKSAAAVPPATGDPEALAVLAYLKKTAQMKHQYKAQFQATFGVPLEDYWDDIGGFDIVKFDETFVKPPFGTSTRQAVYERWGAEAVNLVLAVLSAPTQPAAETEAQMAQERENATPEAAL